MKWLIVGAGGFVQGSVLPHAPKRVIGGLLTHHPIKAVGIARAYGISLYASFEEARSMGCTHVLIASSSWTHLDMVADAVAAGFDHIACEKPIIVDEAQYEAFVRLAPLFHGVMIKRRHRMLESGDTIWKIGADMNGAVDVCDPRKGGTLFNELIHFVDAGLQRVGPSADIGVNGKVTAGDITLSGTEKITIQYDFAARDAVNSLPFDRALVPPVFKWDERVVVPAVELIGLYDRLFEIKSRMYSK